MSTIRLVCNQLTKELVPIAGGMIDGSQWSSKIIERDWGGDL